MKRLITIQQGLKSPKNKDGDKGRFKFRSAEDIFEQAKPFLKETETAVIVTDELTEVGGRVAIKATASLIGDNGVIASASGWACLDSHIVSCLDKNGQPYEKRTMSNEQCTGSASSYARKYALCGLFAIDNDENDPDQPNIQIDNAQPAQHPQPQKPAAQPKAKAPQAKQPAQPQQQTKAAKGETAAAPQQPAEEPLNHEEIAAYMSICADIDASENIEQIKANAARAKGTRYAKKANAHAVKVATEKGWYTPAEQTKK